MDRVCYLRLTVAAAAAVALAAAVGMSLVRSWGRPNSDTGGEFYPLLTQPVAVQRIASSGSGPPLSPPTSH
jgi:hypothetical protein